MHSKRKRKQKRHGFDETNVITNVRNGIKHLPDSCFGFLGSVLQTRY